MDNNFKNGFIKYGLDHGYIKPPKKEKNPAHDWPTYIEQAKRRGLKVQYLIKSYLIKMALALKR